MQLPSRTQTDRPDGAERGSCCTTFKPKLNISFHVLLNGFLCSALLSLYTFLLLLLFGLPLFAVPGSSVFISITQILTLSSPPMLPYCSCLSRPTPITIFLGIADFPVSAKKLFSPLCKFILILTSVC